MALTPEQVERIAALSAEYDRDPQGLSFVEWLDARGEQALRRELEATLTEMGDTATLAVIRQAPPEPPGPPPPPTPQESWAEYAQPSAAPPAGRAWGLSSAGKWRAVPVAPGGKFSGVHYIPPARPGAPRDPAAADVRFTDPQRIAATAAALAGDWESLIFRVSPRGATSPNGVTPGWATLDQGIDYMFEGGELYPEVTNATGAEWSSIAARATALYNWWYRPPWTSNTSHVGAHSLGWYRVYVDDQGFRAYKPFSLDEAKRWFDYFELARHNWECTKGETAGNAAEVQKVQTDRSRSIPTSYVGSMANIYPTAQCAEPTAKHRREIIKKVAAVAAVVTAAIFLPHVAPKLTASLKSLGSKVAGAIKGAVSGRVSDAVAGEREHDSAVDQVMQQVQAAITRGDLPAPSNLPPPPPGSPAAGAVESGAIPPPPSSTSSADMQAWQDYATAIAQWYADRDQQLQQQAATLDAQIHAVEQAAEQAQDVQAQARAQAQLAELERQRQQMAQAAAETQAQIAAEVARMRREAEAVAAGQQSDIDAAAKIATSEASALGGGELAALGLGAAVIMGLLARGETPPPRRRRA